MGTEANIRSLRVQACQTVDLAFNMPGVIAKQNFNHESRTGVAHLGEQVEAYDLQSKVYDKLDEISDANKGRLKFDSDEIRNLLLSESYLFVLRNHALGATLDQAIDRRQVAFMSRFKHKSDIAAMMGDLTPKITKHLDELEEKNQARFEKVDEAYDKDDTPDELKGVLARLHTDTVTGESTSNSRTLNRPVAMVSSPFEGDSPVAEDLEVKTYSDDAGTALVQLQKNQRSASVPMTYEGGDEWKTPEEAFETQSVESKASTVTQEMESTTQALTHPRLDNELTFHQTMVGILQETARHKTTAFSTPDIEAMLDSEMSAADSDIRTLQLNFTHTFLMPPVSGVITGIFKDVGETVEPGEPIMRIENDSTVLIVGRIQCRSPLWVGRRVELKLASVFEDDIDKSVPGKIIVIRGNESDNDEWDIIIEAENPEVEGRRLLPLNYHIDPDTDILIIDE